MEDEELTKEKIDSWYVDRFPNKESLSEKEEVATEEIDEDSEVLKGDSDGYDELDDYEKEELKENY